MGFSRMSTPSSDKQKQILAIDLDDVLATSNEVLNDFINERYGTSYKLDDYNGGSLKDIWKISWPEVKQRLDVFDKELGQSAIKPDAETVEVLRKLKTKYDLVIITARHSYFRESTLVWVEDQLENLIHGTHFTVIDDDNVITKAQAMRNIGAFCLIDDNVEHCEIAAAEGLEAILFGELPWNKNAILPPGVRRAKNWQEVAEYFNV